MTYILIYLLLVNITSFVMFGIDKYRAVHKKWRIPESRLLTSAIIGGSAGAVLGMLVWHHKTLRPKFFLGVPAIIIVQTAIAFYLLNYL